MVFAFDGRFPVKTVWMRIFFMRYYFNQIAFSSKMLKIYDNYHTVRQKEDLFNIMQFYFYIF